VLAYFSKSAQYPNGHPFALSISILAAWVMGMVFTVVAFRYGKTRKMIKEQMALQVQN